MYHPSQVRTWLSFKGIYPPEHCLCAAVYRWAKSNQTPIEVVACNAEGGECFMVAVVDVGKADTVMKKSNRSEKLKEMIGMGDAPYVKVVNPYWNGPGMLLFIPLLPQTHAIAQDASRLIRIDSD